jgi:hypothetical protein
MTGMIGLYLTARYAALWMMTANQLRNKKTRPSFYLRAGSFVRIILDIANIAMKHILSNARLIGTVTPAPKWYPKKLTMNIKPRYTPKNTGDHKPKTVTHCPICDGAGERRDRWTQQLRRCLGCKGSGFVPVVRSKDLRK